jgi:hypothetical protein
MDLRSISRLTRPLLGAVAVALVVASCGRDAPTTGPRPSADLLGTTTRLVGSLLTCSPQPYAADSAVIGPSGGSLTFGHNRLVIPPGALAAPVRITGVAPSDSVNSVEFAPEGLQFARPAALTMSYANCGLVAWLLPKIAYTTDDLLLLYYVPSLANLFDRTVTGQLQHFSRYAIAW